jgi:hypothetical protein
MNGLWPIEQRILSYLDQRGPTHRETVVADLASDDSRMGWRRGRGRSAIRGSNGGAPRLMAAWSRRLINAGWVAQVDRDGFYQHHAITAKGQKAFREGLSP